MKKLVALFGAVSCLLACLPVQASAKLMTLEEFETLHHAESGRFYKLYAGAVGATCGFTSYNALPVSDKFLVVTDSEGLPENWNAALPSDTPYESVTEWEDYATACHEAEATFDVVLTDNYSLQQTYGEDSRFYLVQLKPVLDGIFEQPYTKCRQFAELFDHIRDTLILEYHHEGKCYWDGTFATILNQEYSDKLMNEEISAEEFESSHPEIFGETSALEQFKQKHSGWTEDYAAWLAESPLDSVTSTGEIIDSLNAAHLISAGTITLQASQIAEEVYEQNKDVLNGCFANLVMYDDFFVYSPVSPYDKLGDINDDDELNASDAQMILEYAARAGVTDTSNNLVSDQEDRADLNADGFVNAEDAALVLQYSAEKGAGSSESLKEFLTR